MMFHRVLIRQLLMCMGRYAEHFFWGDGIMLGLVRLPKGWPQPSAHAVHAVHTSDFPPWPSRPRTHCALLEEACAWSSHALRPRVLLLAHRTDARAWCGLRQVITGFLAYQGCSPEGRAARMEAQLRLARGRRRQGQQGDDSGGSSSSAGAAADTRVCQVARVSLD